ncbi:MAG: DapH/DapD/GlmU-related protein [Verrucomicrobiota bacterium]
MSKSILRRVVNRLCHTLARALPGSRSIRPLLHRARGVKLGKEVFIGDDVYLDNEYPECIEIQDRAQISIRSIIIAHTRGPGKVIIERDAFVGPNCVLICGAGKTLRIGQGAVIGAGCVVTRSIPLRLYVASPSIRAVARVKVPLSTARTMAEFWAGLTPLDPPSGPASRKAGPSEEQKPLPAVS